MLFHLVGLQPKHPFASGVRLSEVHAEEIGLVFEVSEQVVQSASQDAGLEREFGGVTGMACSRNIQKRRQKERICACCLLGLLWGFCLFPVNYVAGIGRRKIDVLLGEKSPSVFQTAGNEATVHPPETGVRKVRMR